MNFRYKAQLAREHRALAERLAALTPSWRTPAPARGSGSDCCSSSDWSSVSSLSSGCSVSEWADSGGCREGRGTGLTEDGAYSTG